MRTKALGVLTNWDQECRRVSPDPLGPLLIGVSAQPWTPSPSSQAATLPTLMHTNLDRIDDPELGRITHPLPGSPTL